MAARPAIHLVPRHIPATLEPFIAPARAHPALWRLLAAGATIVATYLLWVTLVVALVARGAFGRVPPDWPARFAAGADPLSMLAVLFSFAGLALGTMAGVRLWHRRPAFSLFGRAPGVLRDFARTALCTFAIQLPLALVLLFASDTIPGLPPGLWIRLLPLALAGVLVQTLAEELVFRGYLFQQLAARFRPLWPALVLPSLAFGAIHYDADLSPPELVAVIAATSLIGLIAADLTRRTGRLGAAWGLHFSNNCVALLLVAQQDTLDGLSLWRAPAGGDTTYLLMLGLDALLFLLIWRICVRVLARR